MSKNIVILGAGFGGLRCALDLGKRLSKEWRIVLVDRNPYHIYSPKLFEEIMPGGQVSGARCQVSVQEILKGTKVEFVQGEVRGIDCKGNVVQVVQYKAELLPAAQHKSSALVISYDYLILALGAGTDYFGIPGLKEQACTLKSLDDAACIRAKVEEFLKQVKPQQSGTENADRFEVVIGGAGATGVEVAAELAYLFRNIPRDQWSVTLVEAFSSVLWMFPKPVGEYADKRLRALGVHLMLDTCIKKVDSAYSRDLPAGKAEIAASSRHGGTSRNDGGVVEVVLAPRSLKPGEIEAQLACDFLPEHEKRVRADLMFWAGGVRANALLASCGMKVDRKGRLEVDEYFQVHGLSGVFALGDNATLINPTTKQPVPATAQAALEQGKLVAENIVRLITAKKLRAYRFHDFSAIVPLADKDGVAIVGGRVFHGVLAWLLRKAADCRYFASMIGWRKAVRLCFFK